MVLAELRSQACDGNGRVGSHCYRRRFIGGANRVAAGVAVRYLDFLRRRAGANGGYFYIDAFRDLGGTVIQAVSESYYDNFWIRTIRPFIRRGCDRVGPDLLCS